MNKKIGSIRDILSNYKNYFFDLDGVIVSAFYYLVERR
jgi:hypothetical protein